MPRCRLLLPVLFAFALAVPAQADEVTFGSDLTSDATGVFSDGNDWAAWNTTLASGGQVLAPATGEINLVRIKGSIVPDRNDPTFVPDVVMHVMVLRPHVDGSVSTVFGGVSEDLPLPFGGDPQRVSTYDRSKLTKPDDATGKNGTRLCIQKGDYLSFTTSGGFGGFAKDNPKQVYVNGAPFQMFATGNRTISSLHLQGGIYPADTKLENVRTNQGAREVLLQAVIGTREDARYTCRTDAEKKENLDYVKPTPTVTPTASNPYAVPPAAPGVAKLIKPRRAPKVKQGKVRIAVACSAAGACSGTLGLRTYARTKAFTLPAGKTGTVTLGLNTKAKRKLKRKGAKLTVKATLTNAAGAKSVLRFLIKRV